MASQWLPIASIIFVPNSPTSLRTPFRLVASLIILPNSLVITPPCCMFKSESPNCLNASANEWVCIYTSWNTRYDDASSF